MLGSSCRVGKTSKQSEVMNREVAFWTLTAAFFAIIQLTFGKAIQKLPGICKKVGLPGVAACSPIPRLGVKAAV